MEPVAVVEAEVGGYTQLTLPFPHSLSCRTLATLSYIVADHTKCVAGKRLLPCSCPWPVAVKEVEGGGGVKGQGKGKANRSRTLR